MIALKLIVTFINVIMMMSLVTVYAAEGKCKGNKSYALLAFLFLTNIFMIWN